MLFFLSVSILLYHLFNPTRLIVCAAPFMVFYVVPSVFFLFSVVVAVVALAEMNE